MPTVDMFGQFATPVLVMDRQHHGKPNREDYGAAQDLDGDGNIEVWERESELTPLYIAPAIEAMRHAVVLDSGWYSDRHREAARIAGDRPESLHAYVACHMNAGGGTYGAVFYDARSRGGKALAVQLVGTLSDALRGIVSSVRAIPATPDDWTKHAYNTLKGIYSGPANLSGVCLEPLFLEQLHGHSEASVRQILERVGKAVALGAYRWADGQRTT